MFAHTVSLINLLVFLNDCLADEALSPPDIRYPTVSSKYYKVEKAAFKIKCNATGLPSPTYVWKKGEIGANNTLSGGVSYDSLTGVLSFKNMSQAEEGEYRCYATNVFHSSRGHSFAVSISPPMVVKLLRVLQMASKKENIKVNEYSYIKLPCQHNIIETIPDLMLFWYDFKNMYQLYSNERMLIDKYGNLHIACVLRKDIQYNPLFCGVTVEDFDSMYEGIQYSLSITSINAVEAIAPKLEYSENVVGELQQSAQLECVFSGYDPLNNMTVTWLFRDGKEITTNKKYTLKYGNRTLEIKNLAYEDKGKYFCKAKLGSKTTKDMPVLLDVIGPPIFDGNKAPKDVTVSQGKDATVPCKAQSIAEDPPSDPIWFINGKSVESQTGLKKFEVKKDSLTIKSVQKPDDIMCVVCLVSNSFGKTAREACINVLLPINVVVKPESEQLINQDENGILNFTVVATTDITQELNYEWTYYRNKEDLEGAEPNFTYYDPETNIAYIDTTGMKEKDYEAVVGYYALNISTDYDYVIVKSRVRLHLQRQSEPGKSTNTWIYLLIICILLLTFTLYCLYKMFQDQRKELYHGESEFPDATFQSILT